MKQITQIFLECESPTWDFLMIPDETCKAIQLISIIYVITVVQKNVTKSFNCCYILDSTLAGKASAWTKQ